MYLFNSPVLKELLVLYQWPGPKHWKRQPTAEEKLEYSKEQREVAELLHPMLVDLLTDHKLGICFRDKSFGLSNENKNSAVSKVLQLLLTAYSTPLSHQLVAAILQACPHQLHTFLKLLQPHLAPRPLDTWVTCLQFFLKVVENHEWPSAMAEDSEGPMLEDRTSQLVRFLFPPDSIINTLKDGLKHACATVRHLCLQALQVITSRGRHFCDISRKQFGDHAPVTLSIEGFVLKTVPNGQVLLNLLQKVSSKDSFTTLITKDLYKDTDVPLPHVSRFQHLVAILRVYSLAPEHLTAGPADALPLLLSLVAQISTSGEEMDSPPAGTSVMLPALCLLHAVSECDVRKLTLFGKGGNKGDLKQSLMHQLLHMMQAMSINDGYMETAQTLIVKLLAGTGLFDGHEGELAIWLRHLQNADAAPDEVVTFFVGLLRQYVPNPYPAIDRLLEQVEESPQLIEGRYLPYVRLEFSPLVMFALNGDFHTHEKVHRYVCSVLIDILHSLHNPCGFSRLVHSLSSDLDPEVTLYLTLHHAEEEATSESIMKRMQKKLRINQLKLFKHAGVSLMKKLMKGEGEEACLEKLSASEFLPLVQLSLRYLHELVSGCLKDDQGSVRHKQLSEVCMKTLKAACNHLVNNASTSHAHASQTESGHSSTGPHSDTNSMKVDDKASKADSSDSESSRSEVRSKSRTKGVHAKKRRFSEDSDSSMDEGDGDSDADAEDDSRAADTTADETHVHVTQDVTSEDQTIVAANRYCAPLRIDLGAGKSSKASLSLLRTDWLLKVLTCLLNHPLISQWLFVEGFKHNSTPKEWIVCQLCDIVKHLAECKGQATNAESIFDVTAKCHQLVEAASGVRSGKVRRVPDDVQPLFCRCLETLLAVGGQSQRVEGLLAVLGLPEDNFISKPTQTPSKLAQAVFRIADSVSLDAKSVKGLHSRPEFRPSFEGLFVLASALNSPQLETLALNCVQSVPELSSACPTAAFHGLLNKLGAEASPSLQPLVEALMIDSPQCRALGGQWLRKQKKAMKQRKQEFAPTMLMYLRLLLTVEDTASDDSGVSAIAEAVCHGLDKQPLDADHVDPVFLLVVCHLINSDMIELPIAQKLQSSIMSLMEKEARLHEEHVQLLAAILRQRSLHSCGFDQDAGGVEKAWSDFEKNAGQVLVGCLRYVTSSGVTTNSGRPGQEVCIRRVVQLCHHLLSLTIHPSVKSTIVTFWPDLVKSCLKYHYKDVEYVSLLRRLVERVFAQEEQADKETSPDETVVDDDVSGKTTGITEVIPGDDSSSDRDDGDDNGDNDETPSTKHSGLKVRSQSLSKRTPPSTQQSKKSLHAIVAESAKRLGLTKKSDVARKCVALFGKDAGRKDFTSDHAEIVRTWTGMGSLQSKSFFLWPSQETLAAAHAKVTLASPSYSTQLVDLCEKCVGHTDFLTIMQGGEHQAVRSELVSLLACLVRLEKTCCSALPLTALVAAYSATLSLTDQNLLYLMLACDLHGNQRFIPGLWGEKAVKQLEMKKHMGKSLLYETSLQNVLELIDPDVMATSILHFPLMRVMEFHYMECAVKAERMMSQEACYDPRFILQVFFHFLGPEHIVDVRTFITQNCLGYTLAALSSHDSLTRMLAIGILTNLHSHVELIQRWSSAPILLAFLKVIMNGMTKECQKLPAIITVFLARAADIFMKPGDDMHVPILSFLMLKAALDVNNVPEFYHFFNSPKPKERVWILQLLQDGLRETSDHRLFQRRFVYKILMCHANSSLSDYQTRRESMKVLVKASSIATVARDLVTKHGLLPWLVSFIKDTLPNTAEMTRLMCQLLHNMCYTPEFNSRRLWWLTLTRLSRQCLLHTPILVCVRLLLVTFSHLEAQSVEMLLDILQHPHLKPSTPLPLLSLVVMIAWHLGRLGHDADATSMAENLSETLQVRLPAVTDVRPQRKDDDQELDASSEAETVARLQRRAWRLLSELDSQKQPWVVDPFSEERRPVQDIIVRLKACLCQGR